MIEIVAFQDHHAEAFKQIGKEWINQYMSLEAADIAILNHPKEQIIDQGGFIFMAMDGTRAVGTCALVQKSASRWELCKLGVSKSHRGLGIGSLLTEHVIQQAKELDLDYLFLESSRKLKAAISLYEKIGFQFDNSSAERTPQCDVQMVLTLRDS